MKKTVLFLIFILVMIVDVQMWKTAQYHEAQAATYRHMAQANVDDSFLSDEEKAQYKILKKALEYARDKNKEKALKKIEQWQPHLEELKVYKDFWKTIWAGTEADLWTLYRKIKGEKKHIRLRLEIFKNLLDNFELKDIETVKIEARSLLRFLRSTSEGELLELQYLKWLQKNKLYDEVCAKERRRWINQPDIDYIEMILGVQKCPMKFEDFVSRLRRLVFSARELQAQRELEIYLKSDIHNLEDWEKDYVKAIFDSHRGEPDTAFKNLKEHEDKLILSDWGENYFYIAQRAGKYEAAEQIVNQLIARKDIKKTQKDDLIFQKALLLYQTGRYKDAHAIISKQFREHPQFKIKRKGRRFEQLAWLEAWLLYLDGDYTQARSSFEKMQSYSSDKNRLAYWHGMTYLKEGDWIEGQQIFKQVAQPVLENKPYSYYNLLAWIRFNELKKQNENTDSIKILYALTRDRNSSFPLVSDDFTKSQMLDLYVQILEQNSDDAEVIEEGEGVNVVNTDNNVIYSSENLGIEVESGTELLKHFYWSKFLIENKHEELAKWHMYELEKNLSDKNRIYELVDFYLKHEFYYRALSLVQRSALLARENLSFDSSNMALVALYPEAYKEVVYEYSKQRKISPYFLLSIMRAETLYKPDAISPVGAVGLMQFMPYTQEKVAQLIGENDSVAALFEPEKAIKYGAAYLKKLDIEMNSYEPLIAAGYNGGPHRVKSWLQRSGHLDFDVFIEKIPFAETRTYVKRVVAYKSIYEKIYDNSFSFERINYLTKPIGIDLPEKLSLKEEWEPFRKEIKKTN